MDRTHDFHSIEPVAAALRGGGVALIPTDTVCGLAVSVAHADGPDVLFRLKGRDPGKAIAWLVEDADALNRFGADVPSYARRLAQCFWPGALTLVVAARPDVVGAIWRGEGDTIGLRVPAHPAVRQLIAAVDSPLATTSANRSGEESPCSLEQVVPEVRGAVSATLNDTSVTGGRASTVVDCTGAAPVLLREGDITFASITDALREEG